MKRIYQLAVVAAIVMAPVMATVPASAEGGCEISNTGPNSENECSSGENYTCEIDNDNKVIIKDSTGQQVASGNVEVGSNGTGGGAISGSASNNNQGTFNVEITNSKTCTVAATPPTETPVTPTNPETPETPAPGKGESAPVQPAQKVTPAALPVTSGNSAPIIVFVGSIVATGAIVLAYRRLL